MFIKKVQIYNFDRRHEALVTMQPPPLHNNHQADTGAVHLKTSVMEFFKSPTLSAKV